MEFMEENATIVFAHKVVSHLGLRPDNHQANR